MQVAIIDGGVQYTHPDLEPNVWVNPEEDLNHNGIVDLYDWNAIDDDGNGFIDDFWGWDWVDLPAYMLWPGQDPGPPDNEPMDDEGHGTHCAGDASAASDNSLGVAAPGFNTQIMCLRAGYTDSQGGSYVGLTYAVAAMYYAIDMGADVISISYGEGPYPPEATALQAAMDAGLVPVAAAGNESTQSPSYPAAYPGVIAVANTGPGDVKDGDSNYGTWITVSAPGVNIMSTIIDGYGNMSGTSMSCPITAGVAALVKSLKPQWNSTQVGSWLSQTADNIDLQNPGYIGLMGGGRLNAYHAVDLFVSVDSLWTQNGQGGSRWNYGENSSLFVQYHKYRGQETNVQLTLTSSNPRVTIVQGSHYIGTITQGQSGNNSGDPFVVSVQTGGSPYEILELVAHFTGDGFDYTQYLEVPIGRAQVLIVDADQGSTKQTSVYYQNALDELGVSWETWKRSDRDSLGSELQLYPAVIHFSGTAQTNIFPGNDWTDLTAFLDAGGKLILTGQNDAQNLAATQPSILTDVLRVSYLQPSSNGQMVYGSPGNPLTQGMQLMMAGGGGAWNQTSMDVVSALLGAQPWFVYNTQTPTQLAGVRTQIGSRDLFFCAFGIESMNDSSGFNPTRYELIQLMLTQFGLVGIPPVETTPAPAQFALQALFPNPFNSTLNVAYELPRSGPVSLSVYDVTGRLVASQRLNWAPAGHSVWNWQAGPELSSGVYVINLTASGQRLKAKAVYLK